jgi:hypothetical protein
MIIFDYNYHYQIKLTLIFHKNYHDKCLFVVSEGSGFESHSGQMLRNWFLVIAETPEHSFSDRKHR